MLLTSRTIVYKYDICCSFSTGWITQFRYTEDIQSLSYFQIPILQYCLHITSFVTQLHHLCVSLYHSLRSVVSNLDPGITTCHTLNAFKFCLNLITNSVPVYHFESWLMNLTASQCLIRAGGNCPRLRFGYSLWTPLKILPIDRSLCRGILVHYGFYPHSLWTTVNTRCSPSAWVVFNDSVEVWKMA